MRAVQKPTSGARKLTKGFAKVRRLTHFWEKEYGTSPIYVDRFLETSRSLVKPCASGSIRFHRTCPRPQPSSAHAFRAPSEKGACPAVDKHSHLGSHHKALCRQNREATEEIVLVLVVAPSCHSLAYLFSLL